ncbi:VOC family protein [Candidatus Saccharibacteria bacterium]|nr:VOC family protein [Candidatus Saccharibacteria bacterium]
MFEPTSTFSGFSVDDIKAAEAFYADTLGVTIDSTEMGLDITLPGGAKLFVYEKEDHQPATFTVLNFIVDDIDKSIAALEEKGVTFEHYDLGNGAVTDESGVLRGLSANMGPDIAWFKDPAGNVLSLVQTQ